MEKLTKTNFADVAENVIKGLQVTDRRGNLTLNLTTTKIRNLLSMTGELSARVLQVEGDVLDEDMRSSIQYLKMRFAYEAGREQSVKKFIEAAAIMQAIDDIKTSKERLILFCNYIEALVAYHRYYGGRER